MNNIIYDDEIITPENNKYDYYENFIKKLNHKDCIKFALFCTKIVNGNNKESQQSIELIEKWLKDEKSVKLQEFQKAFSDIYSVASNIWARHSSFIWITYFAVGAACYGNMHPAICDNFNSMIYYTTRVIEHIVNFNNYIINDPHLYLQTLLRTTKQYNIKNHNNQYYEFILKEIINEDIDKVTDADYNMLIDLSQEYYNINPNITNKNIFIELLRKEYE